MLYKTISVYHESSRILCLNMGQNGLCSHRKKRSCYVTAQYSVVCILKGSGNYRFTREVYILLISTRILRCIYLEICPGDTLWLQATGTYPQFVQCVGVGK